MFPIRGRGDLILRWKEGGGEREREVWFTIDTGKVKFIIEVTRSASGEVENSWGFNFVNELLLRFRFSYLFQRVLPVLARFENWNRARESARVTLGLETNGETRVRIMELIMEYLREINGMIGVLSNYF